MPKNALPDPRRLREHRAMARTAPVPNLPAIPGMNPGLFILGGGGDGGGSGAGGGKGGAGKQGAGGKNGGNDASGDGKNAPDPSRYPLCGTASHPVDVVTGRAFTHPIVDFELAGPIPLVWQRRATAPRSSCPAAARGAIATISWAAGWVAGQDICRSLEAHRRFGHLVNADGLFPSREALERFLEERVIRLETEGVEHLDESVAVKVNVLIR